LHLALRNQHRLKVCTEGRRQNDMLRSSAICCSLHQTLLIWLILLCARVWFVSLLVLTLWLACGPIELNWIESRTLKWAEHAEIMTEWEMRAVYKIEVGKPNGKRLILYSFTLLPITLLNWKLPCKPYYNGYYYYYYYNIYHYHCRLEHDMQKKSPSSDINLRSVTEKCPLSILWNQHLHQQIIGLWYETQK
jgi:hypothetical protein